MTDLEIVPLSREQYLALREAMTDDRLAITQALESSGLKGWEMMESFLKKRDGVFEAFRHMNDDDRMAIIEADSKNRRALMAKYAIKAAPEVF